MDTSFSHQQIRARLYNTTQCLFRGSAGEGGAVREMRNEANKKYMCRLKHDKTADSATLQSLCPCIKRGVSVPTHDPLQ